MKTRAVVYVRVSTVGQADEGVSLAAQLELAERYCRDRGWELVGEYRDVMSGTRDDRPQLRRMEADAKAKLFGVVLVYRTDRLARSFTKTTAIMAGLDAAGVALVSMTEPLDLTTPIGKGLLGMLAGFAEQESVNTGDRVRLAKRHQAGKGVWVTYKVPIGYTYTGKEAGGARVVVDEDRAPLVRRIFTMFTAQAMGYSGIAQALNEEEVTTREGARWYPATVRDILHNPAYTGRVVFGRQKRSGKKVRKQERDAWTYATDATFPAIIDAATWAAAEARAAEQSTLAPRLVYARTKRAWSGMLECKGCGSSLCISNDGRTHRMVCRTPATHCELRTHVRYDDLDRSILPALAARIQRATMREPVALAAPDAEAHEKKRRDAEARIKRAKRLALADVLSPEEARAEIVAAEAQLAALASGPAVAASLPLVPGDLEDMWPGLTPAEQGEWLRLFIERVVVGWEGMTVHLKPYSAPGWGKLLQVPISRRHRVRRLRR